VPADHPLWQIDAVLDLSAIRHTLAPYYAAGGRHSIDPELMIRMLLVDYAVLADRHPAAFTYNNLRDAQLSLPHRLG
jgi:hypothetical protein